MAQRDYRIRPSYSNPREPYDDLDSVARQRSRGEYRYENQYPPGSRDSVSPNTTRSQFGSTTGSTAITTKTTYRVSQPKPDSDTYVTRGNVIVLDSRLDRDRELSDWEVVRPERSESGAYIIETSSTSDYGRTDVESNRKRRTTLGSDIEVISPPRARLGETGRGRRDRSVSRGTLEAMKEVRVTEGFSDDEDRRSLRSRRTVRPYPQTDGAIVVAPPLTTVPTSLRHDHSPESVTRRRSRSIGFIKAQVSHHDVSESRHERPGAEANVAGKYLIDHRERVGRKGQGDRDSTVISEYPPLRKSRTEVIDIHGAEFDRRRREAGGRDDEYSRYKEKEGDYDYDRRREPYPPQRGTRRYRRERDGDDDDDAYQEKYGRSSRRDH